MEIPDCVFDWRTAPKKVYDGDMLIEDAVTDLIEYHNRLREDISRPRSQLQIWVDSNQESKGRNRELEKGDVLQVRAIGPEGVRKYFAGSCFRYDGRRAKQEAHFLNEDGLSEKVKKIVAEQKKFGMKLPKTVEEYVLFQEGVIMLQIARFGRGKNVSLTRGFEG